MTINRTSERAQSGRDTSGPQWGGPSFGLEDVVDRLLPTPDATHGRKDTRTSQLLPGVAESLSEGQLLPTPAAGNFNDGEDPASWEARRQRNLDKGYNGNGQGTPLGMAVRMLPTPAASDVKGANPREHKRDGELRTDADLPTRIGRLLPGVAAALLPTPRASEGEKGGPNQHGSSGDLMLTSAVHHLLRTPTAQLAVNGGSQHPDKRRAGGHQPTLADEVEHLLPTPNATDAGGAKPDRKDEPLLPGVVEQIDVSPDQVIDWGPYAYAIYRWADAIGRMPPSPVEPGRNGKPRLSPAFVEWMQGLPEGWVTAVPKLSRNAQLKALGNGVVPQQAWLAEFVLLRRAPRWVQAQVSRAWQTR